MKYLAYTYLIKCPNGKSYYGYRAANKTSPEDDLWQHYFTSSKVIQELREQYSDDEFIVTIDKTFETAEEAHEYETAFLTENDCVNSDDWLNQQCFPVFQDNKGKKKPEFSEEHRRKLSEAKMGKKLSEETKKKIGEALKGKEISEETRRKMSEASKRRKHTEESKKKMSEARKGREFSEETRRKISESLKGRRKPERSKEHRRKISETLRGRKHSEETKKKMRESHRKAWARRKNKQKD